MSSSLSSSPIKFLDDMDRFPDEGGDQSDFEEEEQQEATLPASQSLGLDDSQLQQVHMSSSPIRFTQSPLRGASQLDEPTQDEQGEGSERRDSMRAIDFEEDDGQRAENSRRSRLQALQQQSSQLFSSQTAFGDETSVDDFSMSQRHQATGDDAVPASGAYDINEETNVLWGTTISVDETSAEVARFLEEFIDPETETPLYPRILDEMARTEMCFININCAYLRAFSQRIYDQVIAYPQEMTIIFDLACSNLMNSLHPDFKERVGETISTLFFNLERVEKMRNLSPANIDQMVSIRGMIIRTSTVIPEMKTAFFQCTQCDFHEFTGLDAGMATQPSKCVNCRASNTMDLIHNRCMFSDKQIVKLQETPDAIPEGETPHTVNLVVFDQLVDVGRPGDRVVVTGVFRAAPLRASSVNKSVKSIYKTYIDVVHLKKTDKRRMLGAAADGGDGKEYVREFDEGDATEQQRAEQDEKMRALGATPNIYERLTESLAPSIWQLHDVKKGILCQLFGGANKVFKDEVMGRFRGEINILLCGDPGTSKSQLLTYVHKIAPRGIYTSGKGSSAVGLTAYVTKDPETREAVLESGALVLSDKGICCIDEFDKMSDTTRAVLHEVMEQQTVSVAKAGIICTLNARTSILASANPIESRYNPMLSVVENIQLPPTLLSRFDLIYLVLDKPNEDSDRKLAHHLVSLYWETPKTQSANIIPLETITQYISYAKRVCQPKIDDSAVQELIEGYQSMRKAGHTGQGNTISATPRQLESLIRIAEAHARIRLSDWVQKEDVQEAIRLVISALQQAAIDPRTGRVDLDLITTGRSASARGLIAQLTEAVKDLLLSDFRGQSVRFNVLLKTLQQSSALTVTGGELMEALRYLADEGTVSLSGVLENSMLIRART